MAQGVTSIHTIAEELGIAPSTVSRALNGHPGISARTRERVLELSRRRRFRPRAQTPCVGVVMSARGLSMRAGYNAVMLSLLASAFTKLSMPIELLDLADMDKARQLHISAVVGVVFDDRLKSLATIPHFPVFSINCPLRDFGIHSAIADHAHGARIATEHLLSQGHRRIAFLEHGRESWGSLSRQEGFRAAMQGAGIEPPEESFFFVSLHNPLYDVLRRIVDGGFTALLNLDEPSTLEAPHILSRVMGVRIPEDLSMVCIEANASAQQFLSPPQTVIHQPLDVVVDAVAEAVSAMLEGDEPAEPLDLRFENTLIFRESVRPIA